MKAPACCGVAVICAITAAGAVAGCGGKSSTTSPSYSAEATITITSSGASPNTVTVKPGSQVTFLNMDSMPHQMYSDPHPEHTDCPEFDSVGLLAPGQRRQTGNLNTPRTCRFHDHIYFENLALRGAIVIQ